VPKEFLAQWIGAATDEDRRELVRSRPAATHRRGLPICRQRCQGGRTGSSATRSTGRKSPPRTEEDLPAYLGRAGAGAGGTWLVGGGARPAHARRANGARPESTSALRGRAARRLVGLQCRSTSPVLARAADSEARAATDRRFE